MQVLYQLSYGPKNAVKPVGLAVVVPKLTTAATLAKHRLHLAPNGSELALNLNLIHRQLNRLIGGVRSLQANREAIAMKMFQGCSTAWNQCTDNRSLPEARRIDNRLHQNHIAISNMGIHH